MGDKSVHYHIISQVHLGHHCFVSSIMPIELNGSCHCGAVKYSVLSSTPVPYQVEIQFRTISVDDHI